MAKLFEKVDDNPGSYFGMLVEGFEDKEEEVLNEDSEYKTLAKLSNGLEVISYPYGYAVSDGYVADRFVVRDGKYIFDDGRFNLSDKDKEKILSLIKKGVFDESLKEDKFVSRDKMSKKDRKELDSKKRNTWGNTNPATRVQPNKKAYDRKRDKKELDEELNNSELQQLANKLYKVVSKYFTIDHDSYKRVEPSILSNKGAYQYLFKIFGAKANNIAGDVNIKEFKNAIKSVFNEYGDFNVYFDKDSFYYFYSTEEIYGVDRKVKYIGFRWFWFEEKGYSHSYSSETNESFIDGKKELDEELTEDSEIFKDMSNALDDIEYLCKDTYNWETSDWNNKENIKRTAERIIESAQVLLDSIKKY